MCRAPAEQTWSLLAGCLGVAQRGTVAQLAREMERAIALGAWPFEIIAGTPHARYGARITFDTPADVRDRAAAVCGPAAHPWGSPDWMGLRVSPAGDVVWKAYHRADRAKAAVAMPRGLHRALVPVMAACHDGAIEWYFRHPDACEWAPFVERVLRALQLPAAAPRLPEFRPLPRAHIDSFCVSVKVDHNIVTAVSFFADDRALPDDREIPAEWHASMEATDRAAYDAAMVGVRAIGRRPARGWHAMLAWTFDHRHGWSRAASLRIR